MRFPSKYLILFIALSAVAEARTISVDVDSRKGVGLIPAFWRGVAPSGTDDIARDRVTWERIDPALIRASWRERIGGGGPGWHALNQAIDSAKREGRRVILTLPVAGAPDDEDAWRRRITDTVRRTFERVDRYEISADGVEDTGRFLRYYESGAWAAYQGHHKAEIGGPGGGLGARTHRALHSTMRRAFPSAELRELARGCTRRDRSAGCLPSRRICDRCGCALTTSRSARFAMGVG